MDIAHCPLTRPWMSSRRCGFSRAGPWHVAPHSLPPMRTQETTTAGVGAGAGTIASRLPTPHDHWGHEPSPQPTHYPPVASPSNVRQRAHQPSPPQPCGPHPLTPQSFATKHTALQHTANDAATRGPSPRLYMHMARCRQGRRRRTSAVDSPAVGAHGSPGLVTHKRGNNWRYAVNPACKRLPPPHPDAATLARTDASAEGRALLNMEQMAADSACFRACMPLRIGFPVLTVFASPVLFFALR